MDRKIQQQSERISMEFRHKNEELAEIGKRLVYENQAIAAQECYQHFISGKTCVILVAQPGAGKTGVILEVMRLFAIGRPEKTFLTENMYLCCGMNDVDWEDQTSKSMIPSFRENIFHRTNFRKKEQDLQNIRDGLIVTDECHIACGKGMTLSKTLQGAGLLDVDVLEQRNLCLLEVSATPESIKHDLDKWGTRAALVILQPSPIYKGFQVMLNEERVIESPHLAEIVDVLGFLRSLEQRFAGTTPKFFLFRTEDVKFRELLHKASATLTWNPPKNHDSNERVEDIDILMSSPPNRHTIILIKGFWRASKRVIRNNVGATYEKTKKRDTTSSSQGLTARFCDNYEYSEEWQNSIHRPLHFCDKGAIEQYLGWITNGCDYSAGDYEAPRMKSRNGRVKCVSSRVNPTNIKNLDVEEEDPVIERNYEISERFNTVQDARNWVSENLTYTSSEYKLCSSNGSDGNTHIRYRGGFREILDEAQLRETSDMGQGANTCGRIMPVRVDVSSGIAGSARIMPVRSAELINYVVIYKREKLKERL
jgi:hypothetical protein